jgi:hypothetical protein
MLRNQSLSLTHSRPHHGLSLTSPPSRTLRYHSTLLRSNGDDNDGVRTDDSSQDAKPKKELVNDGMNSVNLYDPVATASRFLTRRFGIVGGLGLVAVLAIVEGSEIFKAAFEEQQDEGDGAMIELPSGVKYIDLKLGRGNSPKPGDFVGVSLKVIDSSGSVLFDSKGPGGRPLGFTFGKRPYASVVCLGLEEGVASMKRGGTREVIVPSNLTYGPQEELKYTVVLEDVSPSYI